MWSTPESDIPVPLSQNDEKKDALEELRDSQEANASGTSLLSNEGWMDLFSSSGDNNEDFFVFESNADSKWMEFTPEKSRAPSAHSSPGVNTTVDTSNEEIIITPLKQVESNGGGDVDKSMETSDFVPVPSQESHAELVAVTPDRKQDSPPVAQDSPVRAATPSTEATSSNKGIAVKDNDTPTREKSMKKKAFSWFRTRNKETKEMKQGTSPSLDKKSNDIVATVPRASVKHDIVGIVEENGKVVAHDEVVHPSPCDATMEKALDVGAAPISPNVSTDSK